LLLLLLLLLLHWVRLLLKEGKLGKEVHRELACAHPTAIKPCLQLPAWQLHGPKGTTDGYYQVLPFTCVIVSMVSPTF